MQSIVGDVPPDLAGPQVWVDDENYARAREVLEAFRAEREREGLRDDGDEEERGEQLSIDPERSIEHLAERQRTQHGDSHDTPPLSHLGQPTHHDIPSCTILTCARRLWKRPPSP